MSIASDAEESAMSSQVETAPRDEALVISQDQADKLLRLIDELDIRNVIESWIIYRDSGDFDRFAELWHPDGFMVATFFQAPAEQFITLTKGAFAQGFKGLHSLGGTTVDVSQDRAIAQTRMHIHQRAMADGTPVDVICSGRFFDFFVRIAGEWKLLHRQPIYELDRISTVVPGARLELDPELLSSFPDGYRHLAYVQSQMGFPVARNLPGTRGPEVEALMARGAAWLAGADVDLRHPLT